MRTRRSGPTGSGVVRPHRRRVLCRGLRRAVVGRRTPAALPRRRSTVGVSARRHRRPSRTGPTGRPFGPGSAPAGSSRLAGHDGQRVADGPHPPRDDAHGVGPRAAVDVANEVSDPCDRIGRVGEIDDDDGHSPLDWLARAGEPNGCRCILEGRGTVVGALVPAPAECGREGERRRKRSMRRGRERNVHGDPRPRVVTVVFGASDRSTRSTACGRSLPNRLSFSSSSDATPFVRLRSASERSVLASGLTPAAPRSSLDVLRPAGLGRVRLRSALRVRECSAHRPEDRALASRPSGHA